MSAISTEDVASFRERLLASGVCSSTTFRPCTDARPRKKNCSRSLEQLEERGVPVAVALSKPPERCPGLIEPLRRRLARLESIEVRPPEWETRLAIVLARTRGWGIEPKPAVASCWRAELRGNLAQLDVLLTRLLTQSRAATRSRSSATWTVSTGSRQRRQLIRVTTEDVLNAVAQQFNVRPRDLRSIQPQPAHHRRRARSRCTWCAALRALVPEIGRNSRSTTRRRCTPIGCVQNQLGENASLRAAVLLVEKELMRISEEGAMNGGKRRRPRSRFPAPDAVRRPEPAWRKGEPAAFAQEFQISTALLLLLINLL